MKTLFLGMIGLAVMAIAIPAMTTPASAITKAEAQAQCKAQFGGAGAGLAREGASTRIANCVRQKMSANKKK